jgi:hypothetical protein
VAQVPGSPGRAAAPAEAPRYHEQSIRLVLWRHGQTRWNAEGRFQGQSGHPAGRGGGAAGRAGRPPARRPAAGCHRVLRPEPRDGHCSATGPADRADHDDRQGPAGTLRRAVGRPDRRRDPGPLPGRARGVAAPGRRVVRRRRRPGRARRWNASRAA